MRYNTALARFRDNPVLRPQFQDWCSYDSCRQGDGGCPHHDTGEVAEPGLFGLCKDSQGTVGQLLGHVVLMVDVMGGM